MNPVQLQNQLKHNAADLDDFYKELKSWGEEMKKKDALCRKSSDINNAPSTDKRRKATLSGSMAQCKDITTDQSKSVESPKKYKTKVGCTDYAAWDKFDADAECEKVDYDENVESELTDECDENLREEAYLEKEKGNKLFKMEKWDEAIECYTRAIDCYAYDAVFYANRALCFLKKENMVKAEADCTMSLKLDKTYVKAYQRRATAREALNKLEEAEMDLLNVLEIEPKNKETLKHLENLRNKLKNKQKTMETAPRPISKFTASRRQKSMIHQNNMINVLNNGNEITQATQVIKNMDTQNNVKDGHSGNDIISVKTVMKPAHLQSKKPLKRIDVQEISGFENVNYKSESDQAGLHPKVQSKQDKILKTDDLKVVERTQDMDVDSQELLTKSENHTNSKISGETEFCCPKNSIQFYSQWKYLKTLDEKYTFMKLIEPHKLPEIFKESLDTNIFSEILEVLATRFIEHNDNIFKYIFFFTKIRRFSTFTMFMTDKDKNYLRKLFHHIEEHEFQPKEDIDRLLKQYEL